MYTVFNETDGIPAWHTDFETQEKAMQFTEKFRQRFAHQGYYLTARGQRIHPDDIELSIAKLEE